MTHKYEKSLTITVPFSLYEGLARIAEEERPIASLVRPSLKGVSKGEKGGDEEFGLVPKTGGKRI